MLCNRAVLHEHFMYADDIILLAPSVSALQRFLCVCETELQWLDMSINVNKSACIHHLFCLRPSSFTVWWRNVCKYWYYTFV